MELFASYVVSCVTAASGDERNTTEAGTEYGTRAMTQGATPAECGDANFEIGDAAAGLIT
jgi:hypothetical protein